MALNPIAKSFVNEIIKSVNAKDYLTAQEKYKKLEGRKDKEAAIEELKREIGLNWIEEVVVKKVKTEDVPAKELRNEIASETEVTLIDMKKNREIEEVVSLGNSSIFIEKAATKYTSLSVSEELKSEYDALRKSLGIPVRQSNKLFERILALTIEALSPEQKAAFEREKAK